MEFYFGIVFYVMVNVDMENFFVNYCFFVYVFFVFVFFFDKFIFVVVVWVNGLEVLDYGIYLVYYSFYIVIVVSCVFVNGIFFVIVIFVFGVDDGVLKGKFGDFVVVNVFEGDVVNVVDGFGFVWFVILCVVVEYVIKIIVEVVGIKELGKQIFSSYVVIVVGIVFKISFVILVVDLVFLWVGKNFVSM